MPERRSVLKGLGILGGAAALPVGVSTALSGTETITGTITGSDPTDPFWTDYHTEPYEFEASEGDTIEASLSLPNGEPWIHIVSPSGSEVVNTGIEQFTTTAEETGTYTIYPQGFAVEPGSYTLVLTVTGGGGGGGGGGGSFPIPIEGGETVSGNITGSDPTDPLYPNYHTEPYEFEASEGDTIEVSISMPDAAPWIHLEAPSGQDIINEGTESGELTREVTLEETGTYTLYPQAYPAEAPGQYTLTLTGPAPEAPAPEAPPPAYELNTKALGASPTRALFSIDITAREVVLDEYDGSVGGLKIVLPEDYPVQIARISKIPNQDGELESAEGNLLLSAAGFEGSLASLIGAVPVSTLSAQQSASESGSVEAEPQILSLLPILSGLTSVLSLKADADEFVKQSVEANANEGTKTATFSGTTVVDGILDSVPGNFFDSPSSADNFLGDTGTGKYLIEVELADGFAIADEGANWGDVIGFQYAEYSSNEDPDDIYRPRVFGDFRLESGEYDPFVDHIGYDYPTPAPASTETVSSQQDERLTEEESADSVVQKPTRQKPTPQMANSIVQQYDQNSDGEISVAELGEAGQDFAADELTIEELAKIGQEFANN